MDSICISYGLLSFIMKMQLGVMKLTDKLAFETGGNQLYFLLQLSSKDDFFSWQEALLS